VSCPIRDRTAAASGPRLVLVIAEPTSWPGWRWPRHRSTLAVRSVISTRPRWRVEAAASSPDR